MSGFKILEHTADVGLVATGATFTETLSWLATGMFSIIADLDCVELAETRHTEVDSTNPEALVFDWLNELLYVYEADGFLPKVFRVAADEDATSLAAELQGEPVDAERHRLRTAVKAATYHNLQVRHEDEWRIQVVLDV